MLPSLAGYLLASATMAGRMEDNRHYLSDVVFGATIGLTVGGAPPSRAPLTWLRQHLLIGKKGVGVRGSF
jgi:membrane-associated phospholipid phosphatase